MSSWHIAYRNAFLSFPFWFHCLVLVPVRLVRPLSLAQQSNNPVQCSRNHKSIDLYSCKPVKFTNLIAANFTEKIRTTNTYSLTVAFDIVLIGWTFGLIDVRKNADACLIYANQIRTARCSVVNKTIFGVIAWWSRAARCSTNEKGFNIFCSNQLQMEESLTLTCIRIRHLLLIWSCANSVDPSLR